MNINILPYILAFICFVYSGDLFSQKQVSASETAAMNIRVYVDYQEFVDALQQKKPLTGIAESTNYLVLNELALTHHVQYLPHARLERELHSDSPTCAVMKIKTPERELKFVFSLPTDIFLSPKLYQLKTKKTIDRQFLSKRGFVDNLASMMNSQYFEGTLMILSNRSYGNQLDQMLAKIEQNRLDLINTAQPYKNYIQMFENGRSDFILSYPSILNENDTLRDKVRSYAIEGVDSHISGRIMCNKTTQTYLFLEKVNLVLYKLYKGKKFANTINNYLPETEHLLVKNIIKNNLLNEAVMIVKSTDPQHHKIK